MSDGFRTRRQQGPVLSSAEGKRQGRAVRAAQALGDVEAVRAFLNFPHEALGGRPIDLEQRINMCRTDQQQSTPLPFESKELLALSAYVGRQSRGMPIDIADDERTRPFLQAGRDMFNQRQGQLNLSCGQCHDDNWGQKLAGAPIPQGQATGYPLYRLEWQALGSLQRRLRNCLVGMRAQSYTFGAPEYVDLELFLMWRARGMPLETPAVRP